MIYDQLREQKIQIMHRAGRMRISLHGYSRMADVERLLAVLSKVLS